MKLSTYIITKCLVMMGLIFILRWQYLSIESHMVNKLIIQNFGMMLAFVLSTIALSLALAFLFAFLFPHYYQITVRVSSQIYPLFTLVVFSTNIVNELPNGLILFVMVGSFGIGLTIFDSLIKEENAGDTTIDRLLNYIHSSIFFQKSINNKYFPSIVLYKEIRDLNFVRKDYKEAVQKKNYPKVICFLLKNRTQDLNVVISKKLGLDAHTRVLISLSFARTMIAIFALIAWALFSSMNLEKVSELFHFSIQSLPYFANLLFMFAKLALRISVSPLILWLISEASYIIFSKRFDEFIENHFTNFSDAIYLLLVLGIILVGTGVNKSNRYLKFLSKILSDIMNASLLNTTGLFLVLGAFFVGMAEARYYKINIRGKQLNASPKSRH